jgi:hypothetical protein
MVSASVSNRTVSTVMLSSVHQPRDSGWSNPDDATTTWFSSMRYRSANMSGGSPAYGTLVGLCALMT